MSKSSAIGLAAMLGAQNPLGFALLGDIQKNWSTELEIVEFQASGTFDPDDYPFALAFFVECWGGGPSGIAYSSTSTQSGSPGWPSGTYNHKFFLKNEIIEPVSVTIGSGGASAIISLDAARSTNRNPGGDTSFGEYLIAIGGKALNKSISGNSQGAMMNGSPGWRDIGLGGLTKDRPSASSSTWMYMPGFKDGSTGSTDFTAPPPKEYNHGWGGRSFDSGAGGPSFNGGDSVYGGGGQAGIPAGDDTVAYGGKSDFAGDAGNAWGKMLSADPGNVECESGGFPAGAGGSAKIRVWTGSPARQATSGAGGSGLCRVRVIKG